MIRRKKNNARPSRAAGPAGFTLIELLVVIAIISLLVSILLPSLQKAKELAKQVTCATTQRQVAMACMLYAQDNEPYLPRPACWSSDWSESTVWWATIGPYFGEHTTWPLPNQDPSWEEVCDAGIHCASLERIFPGYGMNLNIPEMNGGTSLWQNVYWPKLDAIHQPSVTPLIADSLDWHLGEPYQIKFYADPNFNHPFNVERHMDGESFNAVFCDAHVESLPSERFTGGSDAENEAEVLDFFRGE